MPKTATAYESWGVSPVGVRSSTGRVTVSSSPTDLLDFLRYSSRDTLRIFWDLDSAIAPILRLLPKSVLELLVSFDPDLTFNGHHLYYLPNRMFCIGNTRFYGIRHFWPTYEPNPSTLEAVQDKVDELIETLADCGMPDPNKLVSAIAIFEQTEMGKMVYESIPKGYDLPSSCYGALELAFLCDRREWISCFQIGSWQAGELFDYDLGSAYPSIAADLLDIRDFEFWKSSTYGAKERGAYYGFLKGRLYLDPGSPYIHCSPLMTDTGRIPGNPAGDFGDEYHITLDELRFVERYSIGEFRMADGWFMKPLSGTRPGHPFRDIMNYLYEKRFRSNLAASVMKGVANQLVGKLIETKVTEDYGELRNDIYHATILAQTRIKVAEFLIRNEVQPEELVAVQTDGCRLTREIPLSANGFGKWRCNGSLPVIALSPYKIYTGDRKPGHLTYGHIMAMIAEHPLSRYYGRTVSHRVTLREALQRGDVTLVGSVDQLPAHFDLNTIPIEQNRFFPKFPNTGRSLLSNKYQSKPIVLGG